MNTVMRTITKRFIMLLIVTVFSAIFSIFLPSVSAAGKANAASSNLAFAKKYRTLTVQKKIQYKIKNIKKSDSVSFSVSDASLAKIHKKTGVLIPKKPGKITVKATIYNKKKQMIKTLANTVMIQRKKSPLPNAVFRVKETINPYNFTVSLSCSRILLKKEIAADTLTIYPKNKKAPILSANFTGLSADGKEVVYTLVPSSRKELCPGDFSRDGKYTLESTRFSKKLALTYQERLPQNTLSGFVSDSKGNPIKNALISLKKGGTTLKKCHTDKNGHYQLRNVSSSSTLTVEKEGYQKSTISNPAISTKGTACENIMLRSAKEMDVAIRFLVTDWQNQPIPDASVYLYSGNSSNEELLFSGNTDSYGSVLISNTDTVVSNSCSNLIFRQETILTYAPASELESTNTAILPISILNPVDNYFIYVGKFSTGNPAASYPFQKLKFSFRHLLTNQAFLHIQLEECQNTTINQLTFSYNESLSLCHSLTLYFYYANSPNAFYQHTIEKKSLPLADSQITLSLLLPLKLPDGNYYLSAKVLAEGGQILAESAITPITVQNSTVLSQHITLQAPCYARILAYGKFESPLSLTASFSLYQQCDSHYFYIGSYKSDLFTVKDSDLVSAKLLLNHLLPDQNYLLLSDLSSPVYAKETIYFSTTGQNIYPTRERAEYSIYPLAQIACTLAKDSESLPTDYFTNMDNNLICQKAYDISEEFIRSCETYPNCVISIYRMDGTFLTATRTTPPADKKVAFSKNSQNRKAIVDIYTNKEILITNQDSYNS